MSRSVAAVAFAAVLFAGCRDANEPIAPGPNARVEVKSDPQGAQIFLDGVNTGELTPALLRDFTSSNHDIEVRIERDGVRYGYTAHVQVQGDSLHTIDGPLMLRCGSGDSCGRLDRVIGDVKASTKANGMLFSAPLAADNQSGRGLIYPAATFNGYVSNASPVIAGIVGARDTLALGAYDYSYLAGRPAPVAAEAGSPFFLVQSFWVVPPVAVSTVNRPTMRGIEVTEEVTSGSAAGDVVLVKLTFKNITNLSTYLAVDPLIPAGGISYDSVYVGMALDPDIGTAEDDLVGYDPELDLVFAYDANMSEPAFTASDVGRPALVGLKLVSAPETATLHPLNAWPRAGDWAAGSPTSASSPEKIGWSILSGFKSFTPDAPGRQVGYQPTIGADHRISVSAGPLKLNAGESVSVTVAVIMAYPVAGTYTSGQLVPAGSVAAMAGTLRDKARALE